MTTTEPSTDTPVATIPHTANLDDWEVRASSWNGWVSPQLVHIPSGAKLNSEALGIERHDWEPDPTRSGFRRIVTGADGRPSVTRTPQEQQEIALARGTEWRNELQARPHVVYLERRQIVAVTVDAAHSSGEAAAAAVQAAANLPLEIWDGAATRYSSSFWSSGDNLPTGTQPGRSATPSVN